MHDASPAPPGPALQPASPSRSVRATGALITLLLVLLGAGLGLYVWQDYEDSLDAAELRARNTVRVAAEHVLWLTEAGRQTLDRIADALSRDARPLSSAETLDLNRLVRGLPAQTFAWVFDSRGDSVLTTNRPAPRINIADRDHFKAHAAGAEWAIGPMIVGRHRGHKVFTISRRLERDGRFAGVAVVVIPVAVMSAFYETLALGPQASVGLIHEGGKLVARHPQPEAPLDLSRTALFTAHLPQSPDEGLYHSAVSPADGVARIVAYRRVADLPMIAVVGIGRDDALAAFRGRATAVAGIGGLLLALLGGAGAWVVMLLRSDAAVRRALHDAVEHNRVLLREVHHRVKNNLQVIASLIRLQDGPAAAKMETMRRIRAMSLVHEQIYLSDRFSRIDLPVYLRRLCDTLNDGFGHDVRIEYALDPIEVDIDTALPIALIASEVVTNAFKYAYPDGRGGTLSVTLRRVAEGEAAIVIRDRGVGFDTAAPRKGLGLRMLQPLAQQIGGAYRLESPGGAEFTLTFPLNERAAARAS